MSESQDYYRILGVHPGASEHEIKRAFHQLAHDYHPDLNQSPDAADRFKEITDAYAILAVPERRAAYDERLGLTGRHGSWHGGFHLGIDLGILRVSVGVGKGEDTDVVHKETIRRR